MRFLRNVSLMLLWLAAVAAAVIGLLLTWPTQVWGQEEFRRIGQNSMAELNRIFAGASMPDWLFLFWLLLLILCLIVALLWFFSRPKRLRIERVVDGGHVMMSPQATKHYISTALAPFSDLVCKRIDLSQGRRGLETTVHAELRTQEDVATLERQLIDRVHSALTNDLGIQNVSKVSVVIKEFGLPKGIQPKPVPAVPFPENKPELEPIQSSPAATPHRADSPGISSVADKPSPAEAVTEKHASAEAAPGQAVTGLHAAPADAVKPEISEKGNLVLPQPASEQEHEKPLAEERAEESKREGQGT